MIAFKELLVRAKRGEEKAFEELIATDILFVKSQ